MFKLAVGLRFYSLVTVSKFYPKKVTQNDRIKLSTEIRVSPNKVIQKSYPNFFFQIQPYLSDLTL